MGDRCVETANCENGKVMQRVQTASVKEGGNTWGDQAEGKVKEAVEVGWTLDLAERCKGTGDIGVHVSDAPLKGKAEINAWIDAKVKFAWKMRRSSLKSTIRKL